MQDDTFKITVVLSMLVIGLGFILGIVSIFGDDPDVARIVQYFSTAVPVILGFAFMARKQEKNNKETGETNASMNGLKSTLNGKLDARFQRIEDLINNNADTVTPISEENSNV